MKVNTDPYNRSRVRSRMTALTPYQIYLEQVRGVSDTIRVTNSGLTYYPMQFGGLKGQRQAIDGVSAVEIIDFTSTGA